MFKKFIDGLGFDSAHGYSPRKIFDYEKYRGILIAIGLFIILDASVMVLNFYISFAISADAVAVNLAGRQRMLSQRMTKSLYVINTEPVNSQTYKDAVAELKSSRDLFDNTLIAFIRGGTTQGADQRQVKLSAAKTDQAKAILKEAAQIWIPQRLRIDRFLEAAEKGLVATEYSSQALAQAKSQNLDLLGLMNQLTVNLEHVAASKAYSLRFIQTIGLTLAIINFLFIILHFVRQLRDSDEAIGRARKETTEILQTVSEGLLLVDERMLMGEQYSSRLTEILGVTDIAGQSFEVLLGNMINERDAETARGFIELLFDKKIKPKLIVDLNPLNLVEVNIAHASGGFLSKFLQFSFARAYQGNTISHVLVTVSDVTEKIRLEKALHQSLSHNESQIEMLTSLLHTHPALLQEFIRSSYDCFNRINNILRQPTNSSKSLREKAGEILREIHNFKGESASLKLEYFERHAHAIEDTIAELQATPEITGNHYLGLTVQLEGLISYTQQVEQIAKKLLLFGQPVPPISPQPLVVGEKNIAVGKFQDGGLQLSEYVQHIAKRNGKLVKLISSGINEIALAPAYSRKLKEICIQLLRNAVIHGIESPDERELSEKPLTGRIDLRVAQISESELELMVMDDGAGLDYDAIRAKALMSGRWSENEIEGWGNKKLMALIFQQGFSTLDTVSSDAGRGVGMELVMHHVLEQRGRIAVSSRRGSHCRFVITLPIITAEQLVA